MKNAWVFRFFKLKNQIGSLVLPGLTGRQALDLFCTPKRHKQPEREKQYLSIAHKKHVFPSGHVSYLFSAPHPNQKLLLLVHGWEGRGLQLGAFIQPALDRGFDVITWDGPAHGESPGLQTNALFFARALTADFKELEKKQGRSVDVVVSHSFGAGSSLFARTMGFQCRTHVMIASPSSYEHVIRGFGRQIGLWGLGYKAFFKKLLQWVQVDASALDLIHLNPKIGSGRTIVVHDKTDKEVPFIAFQRFRQHWSDQAHYIETSGLGHRRLLRDPKLISEILDHEWVKS